MTESYEQKVAREERAHKDYLQSEEIKRRTREQFNMRPQDLQRQYAVQDSINYWLSRGRSN